MPVRLLLVDDHEVVRSGLRMLLDSEQDVQIVGEAGTAEEALRAVQELEPDVVLMDIGLPDLSGIEAAARIREIRPQVAVVALTIHEDKEYFFRMLDAGASGGRGPATPRSPIHCRSAPRRWPATGRTSCAS